MECANTNALKKYQSELEKQEISCELFFDSIDDELSEIADMIKALEKKAECYDGYDFTDELNNAIRDL